MHVPNHLISPEVALVGGIVATALVVVAIAKVGKTTTREKFALMGAIGAFIFAAQMLNIPLGGLGPSGHLVGAIIAAALLGPWLGFLTVAGVLTLQALLFADGGLLALGCNIVNMAALGALVAYPLIFRPIASHDTRVGSVFWATAASSTAAIVAGALAVVVESSLSGVSRFGGLGGYMLPVHLLIGAAEGIISGAIVAFVAAREPALLEVNKRRCKSLRANIGGAFATFAISALVVGGLLSTLSSERPDGLEWAIEQSLAGSEIVASTLQQGADTLQATMAIAPDYEGRYTGFLATAAILLLTWALTSPTRTKVRQKSKPA